MSGLLLGIDLGTSAVKVIVVDGEGTIRGAGTAGYSIQRPRPQTSEQHPADWWRATVTATRQALSATGHHAARDVVAIGITGQMHGTVLLGEANEVLAPAIIWADGRSAAEVLEITERVGREHLIELTGSPVATGFQAATVLWLRRHRKSLWRNVRRVVLPKDYLRWRLTWEHATDPSDASGTLLLDVHRRDWSDEMLAAAGIQREQLPPVRGSAEVSATLRPEPAAELGLAPGIPVVTGAGDAAGAALGAGVVSQDKLLLTFSTGAQVLSPLAQVQVDPLGRLHTFCAALEPGAGRNVWYAMGATLVAGMALRWLGENVLGVDSPDAAGGLADQAATAPIGAAGLLFLPYLIGERTPHLDPNARGLYLGLTARHGRSELIRATIEGVAFAAYDAFLALRDLGADPSTIVLAGGGARMSLWRRIVADLFGLPATHLESDEQSALGAAILAGAGAGLIDLESAARSWSRPDEALEPNPEATRRYAELFAIYRGLYPKLKDDMAALSRLETNG